MRKPLRDLEAEITSTQIGGQRFAALLFLCPACGGHSQLIPYSDEDSAYRSWPEAGEDRSTPIWKRTAGSTVDDLTLSPSYAVPSCDLHGHVVAGHWVPC